jgi:hypothetical protein
MEWYHSNEITRKQEYYQEDQIKFPYLQISDFECFVWFLAKKCLTAYRNCFYFVRIYVSPTTVQLLDLIYLLLKCLASNFSILLKEENVSKTTLIKGAPLKLF